MEITSKMAKKMFEWSSNGKHVRSEKEAFFLIFNWREISNAGLEVQKLEGLEIENYGKYVYSQVLPQLAPLADAGSILGQTILFDGDLLPEAVQSFLSATGKPGQELLQRYNPNELYIVGCYRTGAAKLFQKVVAHSLRKSLTIGFVNLLPCTIVTEDFGEFANRILRKLCLIPALHIGLGRCLFLQFGFLTPQQVIDMGFVTVSKASSQGSGSNGG
jgi:hypothetical protein